MRPEVSKKNSAPLDASPKKKIGIVNKVAMLLGFKGIMSIAILIIVVIFSLQNIESTSIQLLFWKILEVPKLYLIAGSTLTGMVIGLILGFRLNSLVS